MESLSDRYLIIERGEIYYDIQYLLEIIRPRPFLFLNDFDIRSIDTLIKSFILTMDKLNAKNTNHKDFHDFHDFVQSKYGFKKGPVGWAYMIILANTGGNINNPDWESIIARPHDFHDSKILKIFYTLIDEFYA